MKICTNDTLIEFYYNYDKSRRDISNVFHVMGDYIAAYEQIEKTIAKNLKLKNYKGLEIIDVQQSSLSGIVKAVKKFLLPSTGLLYEISSKDNNELAETYREKEKIVNDKLREAWKNCLDYSQAVNDGTIDRDSHIAFMEGKQQVITDIDLAEVAKIMSKANAKTRKGEIFSIHPKDKAEKNRNHSVDLDVNVKKSIYTIFNGIIHIHDYKKEIVKVIKPVQEGNETWKLKTSTGYFYEANILHQEFVDKFQKDFKRLDAMEVISYWELWQHKSKKEIRNGKIVEVITPYWSTNPSQGEIAINE